MLRHSVRRTAITELKGGVGNQLFQLNAILHLMKKNYCGFLDTCLIAKDPNREFELSKLASSMRIETGKFSFLCHTRFINRGFSFVHKFSPSIKNVQFLNDESNSANEIESISQEKKMIFLQGYWQRLPITETLLEGLSDLSIKSNNQGHNSLLMHVRRGDFLDSKNIDFFGLLKVDYFLTASQFLRSLLGDLEIEILTDDVSYVAEKILPIIPNSIIKESNESPLEMILSHTMYKGYIISNSTFSWWMARLSKNALVVAPKIWEAKSHTNLNLSNWYQL